MSFPLQLRDFVDRDQGLLDPPAGSQQRQREPQPRTSQIEVPALDARLRAVLSKTRQGTWYFHL